MRVILLMLLPAYLYGQTPPDDIEESPVVPHVDSVRTLLATDGDYYAHGQIRRPGDITFSQPDSFTLQVDGIQINPTDPIDIQVVMPAYAVIPGSDNQGVSLDTSTNVLSLERGGDISLARYLNSNSQCVVQFVAGSSLTSPILLNSSPAKRRVYIGHLLSPEVTSPAYPIQHKIENQVITFYEAINANITVCSE